MRYTRLIVILLAGLLSGQLAVAQDSSATAEARAVLLRYFDALTQGDVSTLRTLMGGDLFEKRSRLLDNPTYPDHLIETYHQASFEIKRYTSVGEDGIAIDAVIVLSSDESVEKRFLLIRAGDPGAVGSRYRIHDEQLVIP